MYLQKGKIRLLTIAILGSSSFTVLAEDLVPIKQMDVLPETTESVFQEKKMVNGVVLDATGMPVIGANVMEKGTTNGTITDMDGKFSLEVEDGAVLQVSYIGFANQEIKVGNQTSLSIAMKEDAEALDELVVVGFGTQKKVNLTGSVGTVESEVLESRPVQNAVQALQGTVPGLQITTTGGALDKQMDINIRGTGTIGEGSSGGPLVLIDGMEGDINSINPQDIENISVLKDAAASSIYGSRAPFGVILITTKGGKSGKVTVNYNNNFRWNAPVKMPKQMDSFTFATYYNDGMFNGGNTARFSPEHLQRIKDFQAGILTNPLIPRPGNESVWADGYDYGCANTDWYDVIYRDWAFSQEHNASVNGGTEKINFYVSMNFLDQNGLMEFNQDTYNRYTTTAKINVNLTNWAKLNYSNRFTREDFGRPSALTDDLYYNLARQGWPTLPVYDVNGYMYSSPSPAMCSTPRSRRRTSTSRRSPAN